MDEKRSPAFPAHHLCIIAALALAGCKGTPATQGDSAPPPNTASGPSLNGVLPAVVDLPESPPSVLETRPNFDDFSWRSFVALNWPVSNVRGEPLSPGNPATLTGAGNAYNAVWGSFRQDYELYTGAQRPLPFDGADGPPPYCGSGGSRVLLKSSKLGDPLSDEKQAFSFPLVDQNGNYIYYEILFNRDQYDFVRGQDSDRSTWLYRSVNLMKAEQASASGSVSMPVASASPYRQGAVMLKAAWKQLTAKDDSSRYFTQQVQIYDPTSPSAPCASATVGLIGLHIAHKVARFPQWVWSSFEHVDNVPPDGGTAPGPMTLNNGTDNPKTVGGWANRPASPTPVANPTPTQVTRFNPIPTTPAPAGSGPWPYGAGSTVDLNAAYRKLLAGTVWANYQLVITQWPSDPGTFKTMQSGGIYPGGAGTPFPQQGAVNTAMETYFQAQKDAAGAGGNSCMQCHYVSGQSDFSWSLSLRAN